MDINKLYDNALLAEAAYADFAKAVKSDGSFNIKDVKAALEDEGEGFSETQATNFVKHWRVAAHQPDTVRGFSAWIVSFFKPTSNYEDDACSVARPWSATGGRKAMPDWEITRIKADSNGHYHAVIPIELRSENYCGYQYNFTYLSLERHGDDPAGLYAEIVLLSHRNQVRNTYQGRGNGGTTGVGFPEQQQTDYPHYLIPDGSEIKCFTKHHHLEEYFRKKGMKESVAFICIPQYSEAVNGSAQLTGHRIKLDIKVDSNRCMTVPSLEDQRQHGKKITQAACRLDKN